MKKTLFLLQGVEGSGGAEVLESHDDASAGRSDGFCRDVVEGEGSSDLLRRERHGGREDECAPVKVCGGWEFTGGDVDGGVEFWSSAWGNGWGREG